MAGVLLLLILVNAAFAFDRDVCLKTAQYMLGNRTLDANSSYFYRDRTGGFPYNGNDNMTLTLEGCDALCGSKQTWYTDIGPRLSIWLFPILLLLGNVELSPLDRGKYSAVLHLLGDPIDSLWSLLHKFEVWQQCATLTARHYPLLCPKCQRVAASVLAVHEEVFGPRFDAEECLQMLKQEHDISKEFNEWRRAAVRLADGRTNEITRTILAIILYFFQLVAAFVPKVGGTAPGPPGGRIATGVLLSWLVPVVLLSNVAGNLTSHRTAHDILVDFAAKTGASQYEIVDQHSALLPQSYRFGRTLVTDHSQSLNWSGSYYTYRPWKSWNRRRRNPLPTRRSLLLSLATSSVFFGFVGAMLVLWYQLPPGLNCRHVWVLGVTLFWCLSTVFTSTTNKPTLATGLYHWRLTLFKDAWVAFPSLTIIFLSAVGLFNFCWCWSGPFQYAGVGRVPLLEKFYIQNAKSIYPTIVGITLCLRGTLVIAVMVSWRKAIRLLRWSERDRRQAWDQVMASEICGCSAIQQPEFEQVHMQEFVHYKSMKGQSEAAMMKPLPYLPYMSTTEFR